MKNLLLIITSLLFICCSNADESNNKQSVEAEIIKETKDDYIYKLGDVMVKWTAFKHSAKAQVGGQFKSSIVEGFTEGTDLYSCVTGVSFKIPVNSTSTNDTVRDYKIVNSFFNTMVRTEFITGKIIALEKNGKGKLSINMNNNEVEKVFNWEMDDLTKEIYVKTSIDVLNWGAQSSLDALNEVCLEQHTGPDGKNVLWPNVDITVIVDL